LAQGNGFGSLLMKQPNWFRAICIKTERIWSYAYEAAHWIWSYANEAILLILSYA